MPERALARVCREAGAVVKNNAKLCDMNLGVAVADKRHVEVLAQGLPCRGGRQLAVDITLRSVLNALGEPVPRAASVDGVVAEGARRSKEECHPELVRARRCTLVVLCMETGGRWCSEAVVFLEELAHAKARAAPPALRAATVLAWQRRWARLLATACSRSFAQSLVAPAGDLGAVAADGAAPALHDVLARGC